MAHITLAGILRDPVGELAVGDEVRFTHRTTTGETIQGSVKSVVIAPDGSYSIDLQYGEILVEYKDFNKYNFESRGIVVVNGSSTATSIPELLNATVPVVGTDLLQFQAIQTDCKNSRDEAAAFAATLDLVNDTSQEYVFLSTGLLASSAIVFPENKPLSTVNDDNTLSRYTVKSTGDVDLGDIELNDGQWAVRNKESISHWDQGGFNSGGAVEDAPNVIAGHSKNAISADVHSATISGGGLLNKENVIGGIAANVNTSSSNVPVGGPTLGQESKFALIGGGYDNVCNGLANVITVGQHCVIDLPSDHGSIHGGSHNKILDGSYNTIGGGTRNETNSDGFSVIAGGGDNTTGAGNTHTTIGGGSLNINYGSFSVISGGQQNTIQVASLSSAIGGGSGNKTEQPNATVAGGNNNLIQASGQGCAIGGGLDNNASGECATVAGGRDNEATFNYSQASGFEAKANRVGEEVFANGKFFSVGDAQTTRIILKGTTGGLQTISLEDLSGSANFPTRVDTAIGYNIRLVAHDTGAANENAIIVLEGVVSRGDSGSWIVNSFPDKVAATSTLSLVTAAVFDSVGSLRVSVTGVAGASLQCVGHVEYTTNSS